MKTMLFLLFANLMMVAAHAQTDYILYPVDYSDLEKDTYGIETDGTLSGSSYTATKADLYALADEPDSQETLTSAENEDITNELDDQTATYTEIMQSSYEISMSTMYNIRY